MTCQNICHCVAIWETHQHICHKDHSLKRSHVQKDAVQKASQFFLFFVFLLRFLNELNEGETTEATAEPKQNLHTKNKKTC